MLLKKLNYYALSGGCLMFQAEKDIRHSSHQTKANVYCFSANASFRIFLNSCQKSPRLFLRRFWIPRFRHSRSVGVTRYASIGDLFRISFWSKGNWTERKIRNFCEDFPTRSEETDLKVVKDWWGVILSKMRNWFFFSHKKGCAPKR